MKTIFLSLGFHGRTESEVMEKIEEMKKIAITRNPNQDIKFIHNYDYNGENRVECLGEAIKKMSSCDYVYFNYCDISKHKGCQIEKKICELYNINHGVLHL